jgi:hypothetical protein
LAGAVPLQPHLPKESYSLFVIILFLECFILYLNYHILIIRGDFIVITPYMCAVYLEQVHPLHYISIPPFPSTSKKFFKKCLKAVCTWWPLILALGRLRQEE